MKPKIHPKTFETAVSCACGEQFTTIGTVKTIKVEICSKCHPFFTGKQKFVDTAGRVEKFQQKYGQGTGPEDPKVAKRKKREALEAAKKAAEEKAAAEAKALAEAKEQAADANS